ncbi:MAG: HAD family hydrolase [Nocardioidaceae bacterium]
MAVDAVIFDWGGTLTPWHTIDPTAEWRSLAMSAAPERADAATEALVAASQEVWLRSRDEYRSATIQEICTRAEIEYDDAALQAYRDFWEGSTHTDPEVPELLDRLHAEGIRVGVLSNTIWPAAWHEEIFARDGVDHLIDGAVYSSSIAWTKPAAQAFEAAMEAVGATDPAACVFVGDRLYDDIYGATNAGLRAVHIPHSAIPPAQVGHSEGEPDAVIERLSDLPGILAHWR